MCSKTVRIECEKKNIYIKNSRLAHNAAAEAQCGELRRCSIHGGAQNGLIRIDYYSSSWSAKRSLLIRPDTHPRAADSEKYIVRARLRNPFLCITRVILFEFFECGKSNRKKFKIICRSDKRVVYVFCPEMSFSVPFKYARACLFALRLFHFNGLMSHENGTQTLHNHEFLS